MPIFLVLLVDASKVTIRPVAFAVRTCRPALVCIWLFDPRGGGGGGSGGHSRNRGTLLLLSSHHSHVNLCLQHQST